MPWISHPQARSVMSASSLRLESVRQGLFESAVRHFDRIQYPFANDLLEGFTHSFSQGELLDHHRSAGILVAGKRRTFQSHPLPIGWSDAIQYLDDGRKRCIG